MENAFLSKLQNKTRILVTHNYQILPQVDRIIMVCDGEIEDSGSFNSLMEKNKGFEELYVNYMKAQKMGVREEEEENLREEGDDEIKIGFKKVSEKTIDENKLMEEEERSKGKVKLRTYIELIRYMGIKKFILLIISTHLI
jgi:ABC-type multidrug transport system ATPase subunit